jgi:hypothetical protein
MALDRTTLHAAPKIERRPALSKTGQRNVAANTKSPASTLQERLGNRATQLLISRSVASGKEGAATQPTVSNVQLPSIQFSRTTRLPVSKPNDPAELEAEETAKKVVRMREAPPPTSTPRKEAAKSAIQRAEARPAAAPVPSSTRVSVPGGSPLPTAVRNVMEPRFGASFSNVRIHTGESVAQQSAALNANAFTVGEHIFFGRDKFQPQTDGGRQLIAHELTHTIQQGAAIQRDAISVHEHVAPQVQGDFLGIPNPREYFANKAANIPGFTLLTVVIGFNPITNARVERSAGNILRGAIQLIPGGKFITDALDAHGIFDKVSAWASQQFETIKDIGSGIWQDIENFIKGFSITDLAHPGDLWDRAKAIVTRPIDRIIAFATALKDGIVKLIKDAILKPLAEFAKTTRGYPLLCTVMGKDPITGEAVAQDAESMLGAFMKFIGEEEIWNNMQKAKAIPRAFAWFKGAISALKGFISEIPGLFLQALRSLEIVDIILIPRAFLKLAHVFGGFSVRFITWGASAVWNLLEIIFDVVSPGALAYIKKTGAALKSILKNPLPFVGNLVKAAKLGFSNFAEHFLDHLKAGLIDWLTGSLPGIYIPKAFSLVEIAKFVFSVLGLSWANIRQKLVKATSETVVKAMETGFDIVVTLVRDGPAAAWDKIKEQLANLKDMVIGGITDFVVDMVVKKAIPKLIAMFIPGAGFISAILSIYDTVMVFVNKIKQIVAVVTGFIDSIVAIAGGAIGAAATRVETALAGVLSLAINFLAGFASLGKVADKVMGVINKIRAPIDKALDWLVNWIVNAAKKLFASGKAAIGKVFSWAFAKKTFKDEEGKSHSLYVNDAGILTVASTPQAAGIFVDWYVSKKPAKKDLGAKIKVVIAEAQAIATEISKAKAKGEDPPAPAKQQELLAKSLKISEMLGELVGRDKGAAEKQKKYLLEGQVGTYAGMPKPVGDQLTPDHQPQASVIQAAAEFFRKYLKIKGGPLADRAATRAAQGYAINLHFKRHVKGATYGSKGETREGFYNKLVAKAGNKSEDDAKAMVTQILHEKLKEDVTAMKGVVKKPVTDEAVWGDLKDVEDDNKEREKLKEKIAKQVDQGENQIAVQPLDF